MKKLDKIAKLLEGISSLICLFPQANRRKIRLPSLSVSASLKNDWEKIGSDMYCAFEKLESQQLMDIQKSQRNNNVRFEKHPKQQR